MVTEVALLLDAACAYPHDALLWPRLASSCITATFPVYRQVVAYRDMFSGCCCTGPRAAPAEAAFVQVPEL